jgi:hypothetical protein
MRWAGKTAAEKRAHAEMMNRAAQKARQAKRLEKAGKA